MADNLPKREKNNERPEATEARDAYLFEKQTKEREANFKRQQFLKDQSLNEGLHYLFRVATQFVLFVAVGVFLIILGRSLQKSDWAQGTGLLVVGGMCVLKGMLSLSGRS